MTDALVEKVKDAVRPHLYWEGGSSSVVARAAILAVLDHFSEPGNVTDEMADECACTPESLDDARDMVADAFRAALRAARDEVSRG